jgi:hypothetical protein
MEYRRFLMSCECGGAPKQILAVGFSADQELVIHWKCKRCSRNVCTVKALEACWDDCFPGRATVPPETPDDRRFLHSIGVKFADE